MTARWPVGGILTFFRYLYSHPVFHDCEMLLLTVGDDPAQYLKAFVPPSRLEVRCVPDNSKNFVWAIRSALRSRNWDLLHSHGFTAGVLAQVARTGLRVPHVMTAHDVFLSDMFKGFRGRGKKILLGAITQRIDLIHAVSGDCADNFRSFMPSVDPTKVRPVRNGIDTERFRTADARDIRTELGLGGDCKLIGFFGRFMAQKGFRTLVDAVELLRAEISSPDFRVLTFGWGGYIREDYDYLRRKGLGDIFLQMPQTSEPETWMKGIDVIAMPSRWEACGLVAMEALCAGVPIIGGNCIGLREVLSGTPATIVPPADSAALANAIRCEFENPSRAKAEQYQETAAARFSIEKNAAGVRALYEELVAGSAK